MPPSPGQDAHDKSHEDAENNEYEMPGRHDLTQRRKGDIEHGGLLPHMRCGGAYAPPGFQKRTP